MIRPLICTLASFLSACATVDPADKQIDISELREQRIGLEGKRIEVAGHLLSLANDDGGYFLLIGSTETASGRVCGDVKNYRIPFSLRQHSPEYRRLASYFQAGRRPLIIVSGIYSTEDFSHQSVLVQSVYSDQLVDVTVREISDDGCTDPEVADN